MARIGLDGVRRSCGGQSADGSHGIDRSAGNLRAAPLSRWASHGRKSPSAHGEPP